MSVETFGMGILIEYADHATEGLKRTLQAFTETESSASTMADAVETAMNDFKRLASRGAMLAGAGWGIKRVGDALLGSLSPAIKYATDFEKEIATLQFVTRATGKEFEELRRVVIDTGIKTAFSPMEATQGLYELRSAGLSTKQAIEALDATLDIVLLSGGTVSLQQGAALMANTLMKFNLSATESRRVMDMLARATQDTMFHIEDFPQFMNALQTSPAKIARPLEEFLAMGGMLRNIGQQPAQAGHTIVGFARRLTMLTAQIERYSAANKKLSPSSALGARLNLMKSMGLELFDSEGAARAMTDVFADIIRWSADKTEKEMTTAFQQLFGDQASNMVLAVTGATKAFMVYDEVTGQYIESNDEAKKSLSELVEAFRKVDGESTIAAQNMLKTHWGIQKLWEGTRQTFGIVLGQHITEVTGRVTKGVTGLTNSVLYFLDTHPAAAKALGYGIGIAGLLLKISGTALIAVGGVMTLVGGLGLLSTQYLATGMTQEIFTAGMLRMWAMTKAMIMPTIGSILKGLLGIAAVAALVYVAWKYDFLGMRTTVQNWVKGFKSATTEAKALAQSSTEEIKERFQELSGGSYFDKLTVSFTKFRLVMDAIADLWGDRRISEEKWKKLNELGLLPTVERIMDVKYFFGDMVKGVAEGFRIMFEAFKTAYQWFFEPFIRGALILLGWLVDIVEIAASLFGITLSDGMSGASDTARILGQVLGMVLGALVGFYVISGIVTLVEVLGVAIGGLAAFFGGLAVSLWGAVAALWAFLAPILPIVLGIGALIWGISALSKKLKAGGLDRQKTRVENARMRKSTVSETPVAAGTAIPGIQMPDIKMPVIPDMQIPGIQMPDITDMQIPGIQMPVITMPSIQVPDIWASGTSKPNALTPYNTPPIVKAPTVGAPQIASPQVYEHYGAQPEMVARQTAATSKKSEPQTVVNSTTMNMVPGAIQVNAGKLSVKEAEMQADHILSALERKGQDARKRGYGVVR
jgi:TP901 family phage tail tape measure protein